MVDKACHVRILKPRRRNSCHDQQHIEQCCMWTPERWSATRCTGGRRHTTQGSCVRRRVCANPRTWWRDVVHGHRLPAQSSAESIVALGELMKRTSRNAQTPSRTHILMRTSDIPRIKCLLSDYAAEAARARA